MEANTTPFNKLAKPAQRALAGAGIKSLNQLETFTEIDLMQLHGIGKNAMQTLKALMNDSGLMLKKDEV